MSGFYPDIPAGGQSGVFGMSGGGGGGGRWHGATMWSEVKESRGVLEHAPPRNLKS